MSLKNENLSCVVEKEYKLNYLLYLPEEYYNSDHSWPVILFLHGMGERGDDLELVKKMGIASFLQEIDDFPFIVVSPQCPTDTTWTRETETLYTLLKKVIKDYNVDTSRIYLTGMSMGGYGSWHLAAEYSSLFAAVVPVCGGTEEYLGYPDKIKVLKDTPVWTFHGAKDDKIPLYKTQEVVDVLKKYNGNVKFTVYPDGGHNVWNRAYQKFELYTWLLQQRNENFTLE